jgi:hypothetical protein
VPLGGFQQRVDADEDRLISTAVSRWLDVFGFDSRHLIAHLTHRDAVVAALTYEELTGTRVSRCP